MSTSPVLCRIEIPLRPAEAFAFFTRQLGAWWPLATNSLGLRNAVSCSLDPLVGGRIFERTAEGLESLWGTITEWQEPERLRFTWHPGRHASTAQEVSVRFTAVRGGTRVELEHGGWDKAGERAEWLRERYAEGWPTVLAQFRAKATGTSAQTTQAAPFHG